MVRHYGRWEDILRHGREEAKLFPRLPANLRAKLAAIPATPHGYPCLVTLKDGTEQDWVYVAQAGRWFEGWGVWPEDDEGKQSLMLDEIADLRESPSRLPPAISDTLYDAGESGMGYVLFKLGFRDGSEHVFPDLPNGKGSADIVSVEPHAGRDATDQRDTRPYLWCLYSEEEDVVGGDGLEPPTLSV